MPPLPAPTRNTGSSAPNADTGVQETGAQKARKPARRLPFHDSTFFIDQSVSTQTVGVGSDYLSRDPVYELWYSFRPRYYFYETESDALNVNARFDVFQELTNSDTTTHEHELLLGDTWLNGVYEHWFVRDERSGYATKISAGPRLIFGTSKASQAAGTVMQVGAGGGITQTLPMRGPYKDSFQTLSLIGNAYYSKLINRCTTPCNPGFSYTRQDTGGRTLISDQVSGAALVNHQIITSIGTDVDIIKKLHFSASYIWVLQWFYPIDDQALPVMTATGPVLPSSIDDPQTFRVSPWILASLDFSPIEEMSLSFGYYNYANQIGPDGQRRSPLWSPDARFFLTITANLDAIYERVSGRAHYEYSPNPSGLPHVSMATKPAKF